MSSQNGSSNYAVQAKDVNVYYGDFRAVKHIDLNIERNKITAFIGPSGCGKSTLLRSVNRMNDFVSSFRLEGKIQYGGQDRELGERLVNAGIKPIQIRYNAICVHLHHKRSYAKAESIALNRKIRNYTKKQKVVSTTYGINKTQSKENIKEEKEKKLMYQV